MSGEMSGPAANLGQAQSQAGSFETNFQAADEITVIVNKFPVTLKGKSSYIFVDVFSFINFDLNDSRGRSIVTQLNKRRAEYMEPLTEGDVIDIYWEEDGR